MILKQSLEQRKCYVKASDFLIDLALETPEFFDEIMIIVSKMRQLADVEYLNIEEIKIKIDIIKSISKLHSKENIIIRSNKSKQNLIIKALDALSGR